MILVYGLWLKFEIRNLVPTCSPSRNDARPLTLTETCSCFYSDFNTCRAREAWLAVMTTVEVLIVCSRLCLWNWLDPISHPSSGGVEMRLQSCHVQDFLQLLLSWCGLRWRCWWTWFRATTGDAAKGAPQCSLWWLQQSQSPSAPRHNSWNWRMKCKSMNYGCGVWCTYRSASRWVHWIKNSFFVSSISEVNFLIFLNQNKFLTGCRAHIHAFQSSPIIRQICQGPSGAIRDGWTAHWS